MDKTAIDAIVPPQVLSPGLRLERLLGCEDADQLADLIVEIRARTGYGCIKIILTDGGIVDTIKKEESFRGHHYRATKRGSSLETEGIGV